MKLFFSPTSPYARKVMAVAHEKKVADRIELVKATASPTGSSEDLKAHNPLGKLPCLVLDDGRVLFDSSVITAYLDGLSQPLLNPASGPERFDAMTLESLVDGMLDACLLMRYEKSPRPPEYFWQGWYDGQMAKVDQGLALLETRFADALNGKLNIGVIAVGCMLGYLDLRFGDKDWRGTHPKLAQFAATIGERPSMQATKPVV